MNNYQIESKKCECYMCGKKSVKKYNFTLRKWCRAFKCKCGSASFRYYNF